MSERPIDTAPLPSYEIMISTEEQTNHSLLNRLKDTVVSNILFSDADDQSTVSILGSAADGRPAWQLTVAGSARFTFCNPAAPNAWLVEANFDSGGMIRRSERSMMLAMCGAVIHDVETDKGLNLRSQDGRAIEIAYVLNAEGVALKLMSEAPAFIS